jgi:hypothetical protein
MVIDALEEKCQRDTPSMQNESSALSSRTRCDGQQAPPGCLGPGGVHPLLRAVAARGRLVDRNFGRAWGRPLPGRETALGSLLLPALRVDSRRGLPPGKAGRVDPRETQKIRLKRTSAEVAAGGRVVRLGRSGGFGFVGAPYVTSQSLTSPSPPHALKAPFQVTASTQRPPAPPQPDGWFPARPMSGRAVSSRPSTGGWAGRSETRV